MEHTLSALYQQAKKEFNLTLVAGEDGLDSVITWAHLIEDVSTTDFLRGNEVVITTGLRYEGEQWLIDFIENLMERGAKGLIINIGQYILSIPESVVHHCERLAFPLFTMPWEIHLEDIMQRMIYNIIQAEKQEVDESAMFLTALLSPSQSSKYLPFFQQTGYSIDEDHSVVLLKTGLNMDDHKNRRSYKQISIKLQNMLHRYKVRSKIVEHRDSVIVILRQPTDKSLEAIAERMIRLVKKDYPLLNPSMVVGPIVAGIVNIHRSYSRCVKAMKAPYLNDYGVCYYDKLGMERLLFEVDDHTLLESMKDELLGDMLEYDRAHKTSYIDMLRLYIEYDCSINKVSAASFTHRNTVNYRMNKIKSMLPLDLNQMDNRFKYLMAFYILDFMS